MSQGDSATGGDDHGDHHVHFDSACLNEAEKCVTYQLANDKTILIRLGFLQIEHRYHIDIKLPAELVSELGIDPKEFTPKIDEEDISNARIVSFSGYKEADDQPYLDMKLQFLAHKEKLVRETVRLIDAKNIKNEVIVVVMARVLGKGKGTPMLRTGIHCVATDREDGDSDQSDLVGFDNGTETKPTKHV